MGIDSYKEWSIYKLLEGKVRSNIKSADMPGSRPKESPPAPKSKTGAVSWLGSMKILNVKDGDIVVLRHPMKLSNSAIENIKTVIKPVFDKHGLDVTIMVIEENMDIGVLRKKI